MRARSQIELPILIVLWYLCTAFASIETKKFAASGGNLFEFTFWSFFVAVPLWLYAEYTKHTSVQLMVSVGLPDPQPAHPPNRSYHQYLKSIFKKELAVALLQACHIHFTNITIKLVDVKFAYMVQVVEPLVTLIFQHSLVFTLPAAAHIMSLMPVPFGVYLSTAVSSSSPIVESTTNYSLALFTAFISVATVSARNVLFKGKGDLSSIQQAPASIWDSAVAYWRIASVASICLLPGYIYSLSFARSFIINSSLENSVILFKGVMLHVVYNTLSIITLAKMEPVTHSLLNVIKRILTVTVSMIYFNAVWIPHQVLGILLANLGVASYAAINHLKPSSKTGTVQTTHLSQVKYYVVLACPILLYMTLVCGGMI